MKPITTLHNYHTMRRRVMYGALFFGSIAFILTSTVHDLQVVSASTTTADSLASASFTMPNESARRRTSTHASVRRRTLSVVDSAEKQRKQQQIEHKPDVVADEIHAAPAKHQKSDDGTRKAILLSEKKEGEESINETSNEGSSAAPETKNEAKRPRSPWLKANGLPNFDMIATPSNSSYTPVILAKPVKPKLPCQKNTLEVHVEPHIFKEAAVTEGERPEWCLDQSVVSRKGDQIYLAAVTHVRIYPWKDKPKLNVTDLAHWLTYYRYAGVEKVYLYDSYQLPQEQFQTHPLIAEGIKSGYIEYIDWKPPTRNMEATKRQVAAYQDVQQRSEGKVRWMVFTDMDEYPYRANDTKPGFMARMLSNLETEDKQQKDASSGRPLACNKRMTQYKMKNIIVHGTRGDTTKGPMLIQQVDRIDTDEMNRLVKQIVRMDAAKYHNMHHSKTKWGGAKILDRSVIEMKHFWGGRNYNWVPTEELADADKEQLFSTTIPNDMGELPSRVLQCF